MLMINLRIKLASSSKKTYLAIDSSIKLYYDVIHEAQCCGVRSSYVTSESR